MTRQLVLVGPAAARGGPTSAPGVRRPARRGPRSIGSLAARPPRRSALAEADELRTAHPASGVARPAHAACLRSRPRPRACSSRMSTWSSDDRPEFLDTIDEETDRLNRAGRQPARHEPAPDRRAFESAAARRSGSRRSCRGALAELRRPRDRRSRSTCPRHFRRCSPIPRCSSGRSPTSSPTRCGTRRPASRCGSRPERSATASTCASSTAGPGIPTRSARPHLRAVPTTGRQRERHRRRARTGGRPRVRRGHGRRARARRHARRRPDRHHSPACAARSRVDAMTRVLVVDDEPQIRRRLGHQPRAPAATRSISRRPARRRSTLAADRPSGRRSILDLGLPGIDGIEVIRGLRGWTSVPIIVLLGPRRRAPTRSRRSMPVPTTT